MRTINKELFKSTTFLKLVLFLFLGMSYFQSNAQCPPTSTYSSVNATDVFTSDGQITVTVDAPAVGPFDFYLTDVTGSVIQQDLGQVSNIYTFPNVSSGFYRVNINNANCVTAGFNTLDSVYVYPTAGGNITYTGDMSYCGGAGATLTAYINSCSTPNSPFSNNWDLLDISGVSIINTSTTVDSLVLPILTTGDYILSVTNTENNCTAIDTFTIIGNALSSTYTSNNVSASGAADGSIIVNISNGTAPYSMWFDDGTGFSQITGWQNGDPITGLDEGTYTYWITDAGGCQTQNSVQIYYNSCSSILSTIGICAPLTLYAQTTNALSGIYNYTYNLSFDGVLIESVSSVSDSIVFTSLAAESGSYSLEVINDSTGCLSNNILTLNPNPISIHIDTIIHVDAQGACNGSVIINILGGSVPYWIYWDTSGFVFDSAGPTNSGPHPLTSLCENTYSVAVTDINGCIAYESFDINFSSCNTTLSVTDSIDCYDGSGQISATIDTMLVLPGPIPFVDRYTYTLYSLNPTTQIGLPISSDNLSNSWNGLFAGDYLVDVVDNSYGTSCTSDSITLTQPDQINIYLTTDSTSAPWILDGSITIDSITGGTTPYSYQWLDSVGIPFSTSSSSVTGLGYSNQYNGGFTLVVTDTNGCVEQLTVYIHPENAGANLAIDSVGVEDASCFGVCDGKMYMRPLNIGPGSVPPFTYIWRDDAGNIMKVDSLGSVWYNPSHVATYVNRCAGQYTLEVFDYYGNSLPPYLFTIDQPDIMVVNLGPDIIIPCGEDTVLTVFPTGGNLTNDTTLINTFILDFDNPSGLGDTLITGQDYVLVVSGTLTDASGNTYDAAYDYTTAPTVTPNVLWTMDGQTTQTPTPNMYNSSHVYTYEFTGQAFGGIPGMSIHTWAVPSSNYSGQLTCQLFQVDNFVTSYSYTWTTANPLSFPAVISNEDTCLAYPGIDAVDYTVDYIVTVEDINSCTASDTISVGWDLYILDFTDINITHVVPCYGNSTGTISVNVDSNSGFGPYVYSDPIIGTNGALTYTSVNDTTFGLSAGDYIFCLQDSLGCLSQDTIVTITQPDSIWACGIGNTNVQFEIDNFVMDIGSINSAFNHTSVTPTLLGVNYMLVVEGTYGLEFFNSNHKDAAFITATATPINDWTMDGSTIRPDIDVYTNTHIYEYTFLGDGNVKSFDFSDIDYTDNAGSLTFTLYKLGCLNTDTVYTCSGDSTAYSSVSATGGVPFDPDGISNSGDEYYNFIWNDVSGNNWTNYSVTNGVTSTISGIPSGLYTVTIEDANGCSEYERYLRVLESTSPLVIDSTEVLDVLCFGEETAQISAYFSGGYGPYLTVLTHINGSVIDTTYQSIHDVDSVVVDSLIYGSYTLYIYDSIPNNLNGEYFCPQVFNFNINQPQTPMSSTVNLLTHVSCWGDTTGAAKVIASGGQSQLPYSYLWDNGETTATADSLWADVNLAWPSPQWQGVTITDSNGCSIRDSIQIEHLNHEIQAYNTADGSNTVQVIQDVQCFNACDAIATVSSVGGVLPHSYSWDIGQIGNFMPDTATGLCFGGHDIIIEDQVGCRKTVYFQISQPDELFANAQWVDMIDCYGYDNGIAHGTATGGTLPYTFVWDSLTGQMNDTAYNLTPGIHTVIVTDDKGCMATDTVTITEPTELTIAIQDTSTVYSYCTGTNSAQLYAIAFGGIEPYNYVWSDVLGQTTQLADDLMAGIYTVTVLDDRGCSASDTRNIDSVTNSMDATTAVTNVSCFGLFDGSTYVDNIIGAVAINNNPITDPTNPPYIFNWTGPNGYTANQNQINFLYAGNYGVTITDSNNCSVTIYTNVQEPDQLEYTLYDVTESTCFGACNGSISVNVEGGTAPYSWDGDQLGNYPFTNPVSLINDSLILDLCTEDYDIYVTDANDCIGTVLWGGVWQATIDSGVVVTIIPPIVSQSATCFNSTDGHATVAFPINTNFSYTWETLGGVVVDTGITTSILSGGDYNLVAHYSDSANFGQVYSGCDASVTFNMPSAPQILANENITPISCYGDSDGAITLNVSGGTGSYTYQWDTTVSVPNGSTDPFITGLQEGTYTVTITDGMGCTETIEFDMVEPDAITNNFTNYVAVACNGQNNGSVTANPLGGTTPYNYSWSPSGGGGQTANNLTAGDYTVTITDNRSCSESFDITITEPESIISGVEPNAFYGNDPTGTISYHISCNGLSDGAAIVNLGGGTAPYTYSWTTGGSNQLESNMPEGTHSVTVTDVNNCSETMSVTLVEPDVLVVNGSSTGDYNLFPGGFDITCKGLNDGECYADPYGGVPGTAGYMYSWSGPINGQISNLDQITSLYVGTYSVTVTDANGCTDVQSFTLTEPSEEFISTTHIINYAGAGIAPVLVGFQDATVSVDPYNYTFYWPVPLGDSTVDANVTTGQIFPNHSFDVIGENEVYIKVQNMNSGCIDDTTFIIEVQGIPDIHNVFTPNSDGTNDYFSFGEYAMESVEVLIYNRWGELVYSWDTPNEKWDGRGIDGEDLPEGVYYYVLNATGEDGYFYTKKGSITLLR